MMCVEHEKVIVKSFLSFGFLRFPVSGGFGSIRIFKGLASLPCVHSEVYVGEVCVRALTPQFKHTKMSPLPHPTNHHYIFDSPLVDGLKTFSLASAPPCQYRFLDIQRLLTEKRLSILSSSSSSSSLPSTPYATISYVWRVLKPIPRDRPAFAVQGIENDPENPISLLQTLCTAARALECELLWLDKLCIRQDGSSSAEGKRDNAWQVEHMYQLYSNCSVCLILPGGLGQLVSLEEKPAWMERCWTLQEALAPPVCKVVFAWRGREGGGGRGGDAVLQSNFAVLVEAIVPGEEVAVADLKGLLQMSLKPQARLISKTPRDDSNSLLEKNHSVLDLGIFGAARARDGFDTSLIMALLGALEHTNETGRLNAIWRCTMLRSAKLPQDMIYSIMGLMNITLRVDYDQRLDDIVVEFTAKLLANGWSADWLGIAPDLGPHLTRSAMPLLPKPSEKGGAVIEAAPGSLVEVKTLLRGDYSDAWWWWLRDAPTGDVDRDGFLTFRGRAVPIREGGHDAIGPEDSMQRDHPDVITRCADDKAWSIFAPSMDSTHYAVVIGHREQYLSGIFSAAVFPDSTLLMILERGEQGTFRNIGYAWADENLGSGWACEEFKVGG